MEYHGKLYGKIGNKHFDTGRTSADFDNLVEMLKYFTAFPDSDFEDFSYNDKFEMTVMTHKIAEAKELLKHYTK